MFAETTFGLSALASESTAVPPSGSGVWTLQYRKVKGFEPGVELSSCNNRLVAISTSDRNAMTELVVLHSGIKDRCGELQSDDEERAAVHVSLVARASHERRRDCLLKRRRKIGFPSRDPLTPEW